MTTLSLTEAKARLNELVDEAVRTHERVTITRHGRPAVVMLSVDDPRVDRGDPVLDGATWSVD